MPNLDGQMADAIQAMVEHRAKAAYVDRRGWADEQWVEDARRLMGDIDGSVTSLVNGHVLALLAEVDRLTAERDRAIAAELRRLVATRLAEPHNSQGEAWASQVMLTRAAELDPEGGA